MKPWQKVLVDQALFNPAINLVALPVLGILNRNSIKEIQDNIQKNYIDIMLASYRIWPMVQMINFYIVPLNYRYVYCPNQTIHQKIIVQICLELYLPRSFH